MFLFSLLCNKQQLNYTEPAVFILFYLFHIFIQLLIYQWQRTKKVPLNTIQPTQLKAQITV